MARTHLKNPAYVHTYADGHGQRGRTMCGIVITNSVAHTDNPNDTDCGRCLQSHTSSVERKEAKHA